MRRPLKFSVILSQHRPPLQAAVRREESTRLIELHSRSPFKQVLEWMLRLKPIR